MRFSNSWVTCPQPVQEASIRLFCFPYAGGGASIFRTWPDELPSSIEVCPIQLPGRENWFTEPPYKQLLPLVQVLAEVLDPYLDLPFIFFGHSMGALICFELARRLRKINALQPVHLFISGHRAPHLLPAKRPIHQLPDSRFLEELRDLSGTPEEVLQNIELMQLLLPTLRADFSIVETYVYIEESPLDCSITAFGGLQDPEVHPEDLKAWQTQTHSEFTLHMYSGDHFFLRSAQTMLLEVISKKLMQLNI